MQQKKQVLRAYWKLLKFTWDLIGSEFAGRHTLYEKFYGGHSVIVRNQSYREAPWDDFHAIVDDALAAIPVPGIPGINAMDR